MTSAARYQLLDRTIPGQGAWGGGYERAGKQTQEYGQNLNQTLPYLALYRLKDMDWLHEEGCGFWEVDLGVDVNSGEGKERRSVFEVAEFETRFWKEVVGGLETQHEEGAETGGEELAEGLIVEFVGAEGDQGRDPEAMLRNSVPLLAGAERVRSTLFTVDESRPCPPSARGNKKEVGLQPFEKSYLCLVSMEPMVLMLVLAG